MEKRISVKLNGARLVSGRLRGYDHFMNIVLDESVEEAAPGSAPGAGGEQRDIGLVVRRRRVGGAARSQPRCRPPPPPPPFSPPLHSRLLPLAHLSSSPSPAAHPRQFYCADRGAGSRGPRAGCGATRIKVAQ